MKRMKRFSCVLAAIGVLMMNSNPVSAKFGGTLRSDMPWQVEISPETNSVKFAATITFVDSRGRLDTDLFTTQPGGTLVPYNGNIPRGARRIIIELDFALTGTSAATVKVLQGGSLITVNADNETSRIVFDVD